jgi:hypothetical protein
VTRFGEPILQRYLRKIFFEESRDIDAYALLGRGWREDAICLANASKKWERKVEVPIGTLAKSKAYLDLLQVPSSKIHNPLETHSFAAAFGCLINIRRNKFKRKLLRDYADWGIENLPDVPAVSAFAKVDSNQWRFYQWITVIEQIHGISTNPCQQNRTPEGNSIASDVLLLPQPYSYDLHTTRGRRIIAANWTRIAPGIMLPAGLDLRWSGSILGVAYRERAFEMHGDGYRDAQWQSVPFTEEEWKLLKTYDSYFYRELYEKLEPEILDLRMVGNVSIPPSEVDGLGREV